MLSGKLSSLLDRPPLIDSTLRPKIYLGICCFLLLAWGGWQAWSAYQEKQQERWITTAENLFQQNDWRGASVAARRALYLKKNPDFNLRATLVMARICRELQIPQEIYWRSEMARLLPDDFTSRENLVQAAIRHNSLALAGKTLESIPPSQRSSAAFHRLMSIYALATNQPAYAKAALREALKQDPSDPGTRLNLAKVLLAYGSPQDYAEAQDFLNSLQTTPENKADILRTRIEALKLRGQMAEALTLSDLLQNQTQTNFNDKITHLSLVLKADPPKFPANLLSLQKEAAPHSAYTYQLASWLRRMDLAKDALHWLDSFPPDSRNVPPLSILWAECAVSAKEWTRLEETLEEQDWGETESLRLAFIAKARSESSTSANPEIESLMQKSLTLAKPNPALCLTLGDLFASWSWNERAAEAWWQVIRTPQAKLALGKLFDYYKQERDLKGIWRVSKTAGELDPSDLVARNNFAMTSLVLGNGTEAAAANARDLYLKNPEVPAFASTYAFSLYLQNKSAEALAVFEKLPPASLQDPGIAPYYVLALVKNKRFEEAARSRSSVQPGLLFPEELALYQKADRAR